MLTGWASLMGSDVGRAAVAMADLLVRPDAAEIVAALRAAAPTWLTDQLDAAADQLHSGLRRAAAARDLTVLDDLPPDKHPAWVRLSVCEALVVWAAGRGSTCLHSPDPRRPEPIGAAAWKPNLVVCGECTDLLALPRNSTADRTCDACGTVTAGLEYGDGIWPSVAVCGILTFMFGTCRDCCYWPDESTVEETR